MFTTTALQPFWAIRQLTAPGLWLRLPPILLKALYILFINLKNEVLRYFIDIDTEEYSMIQIVTTCKHALAVIKDTQCTRYRFKSTFGLVELVG